MVSVISVAAFILQSLRAEFSGILGYIVRPSNISLEDAKSVCPNALFMPLYFEQINSGAYAANFFVLLFSIVLKEHE